jgi:hypothetical protein
MARCRECGANVGFMMSMCDTCIEAGEQRLLSEPATKVDAIRQPISKGPAAPTASAMPAKFCSNCGASLAEHAKHCSQCGAAVGTEGKATPQGKEHDHVAPRRAQWNAIAKLVQGLFTLAILAVVWNTCSKVDDVLGGGTNAAKSEKLHVGYFYIRRGEYGNRAIVGDVTNKSAESYSYVAVNFNLYDAYGVQVGSTLANVNNLDAHGTWNFEAPVLEESAQPAKLVEITAF